jgi:hypothetical protein
MSAAHGGLGARGLDIGDTTIEAIREDYAASFSVAAIPTDDLEDQDILDEENLVTEDL